MITGKDIIGQSNIVKYIRNVKTTGHAAGAYIIQAPDGYGKLRLAKYFAYNILCTEDPDEPCGRCHSCIQADSGNHPDIIIVTHEKPSSISTDEIRDQLVSDIRIRPYASKYKIYIVPDADKMTPQAQNALLKSIEEPPEYAVVLLLVQNIEKLLSTIISRCVTLDMKPVRNDEMIAYIKDNTDADEQTIMQLINFAAGNPGRALKMATDGEFMTKRSDVVLFMKNLDKSSICDMEEAKNTFRQWKDDIEEYLELITAWYRDMLLIKSTGSCDDLFYPDMKDYLRNEAREYSFVKLGRCIDEILTFKIRINGNVNYDLAAEVLFMHLVNE